MKPNEQKEKLDLKNKIYIFRFSMLYLLLLNVTNIPVIVLSLS